MIDQKIDPRYQRNINALSPQEVATLHQAKVAVVGSGGLGGYIVEILARIGVHHITLIDYDVFDINNLNRQLFCEEALIGTPKVDAAQARIAKVNSHVQLTTIKEKLTPENAPTLLQGCMVVVDALDNIPSRLALATACDGLNIPLVHGSIAGWLGQVTCHYPNSGTMGKIFGHTQAERGIEKDLGNLPFTASTVASLQAAMCVKLLTGKEVPQNEILQIDLLYGDYTYIKI